MSEFFAKYGGLLIKSTYETGYMTLISTFVAYLIGFPLGVLLTITKPTGLVPARRFNLFFAAFINIMRSLPFMILLIFVIPITRFITGTSIGATAATVPLVIASAPFIARMVETSLEELNPKVIESARCMGATNFQIVFRVMLFESIPSLLRGLSISTITILGYTAVTGAMGAGGLGDIAYRYGFQRYVKNIMYITVIILILMVFVIQGVFNMLAAHCDKRSR